MSKGTLLSDFDIGENTVVPALRALDVDELELVIASHADIDHIEGLASVLREIPVQRLVIGYPSEEAEAFEAFMDIAEQKGIPVTEVRRGEVLRVGEATLTMLHPTMEPFEESNENSVAFVLSALGTDALFLGDMASVVEDVLAVPDIDVLMVSRLEVFDLEAAFRGGATRNGGHLLWAQHLRASEPGRATAFAGSGGGGASDVFRGSGTGGARVSL